MNHELEVMSRLVDYHDHISSPPVPVAYDLNRGRRRVRRDRALLAGSVAIGLASVIAAVSLFTGEGLADRPQPVGPPTTNTTTHPAPDNLGLSAPLVAPKSLLDVRELGFNVESVQGFIWQESWSLGPDHQGTSVRWTAGEASIRVNVYYRGISPKVRPGTRQAVSVNGAAGTYSEMFSPDAEGHWSAQLVWEYAPDSWAEVVAANDHSQPPQAATRSAFLTIAEAVRSGGGAIVRLPFRVGTVRGPLPPAADVSSVTMQPTDYYGTGGWESSLGGDLTLGLFVNGTWCDPDAEPFGYGDVQPFTYRGYEGCLRPGIVDGPEPGTVVLRVGVVDRVIIGSPSGYRVADLKRMLAELEVTPSDDPTTWFDVGTALGG